LFGVLFAVLQREGSLALEVRLLGEIAVLVDGELADLGGMQQRGVLVLLVLSRNRPISADSLTDRLWPDEQPPTALKTVQVYVSRIRRLLGPYANRLTTTPAGYVLTVAQDEVDAGRFEQLLEESRRLKGAGAATTAIATLEMASRLWRGTALAELALEAFAIRESSHLEELRLQATQELLELRLQERGGRDVITDLRRAAQEQPDREHLWRLLMLALYHDGRQAEALSTYHVARRHLSEELGLDPSAELQDLQARILAQDPTLTEGLGRESQLSSGSSNEPRTQGPASDADVAQAASSPVVAATGRAGNKRLLSAWLVLALVLGIGSGIALITRPRGEAGTSSPRIPVDAGLEPMTWTLYPGDTGEPRFGGSSDPDLFRDAAVTGVTPYADGFLAVGHVKNGGQASMWQTNNGTRWVLWEPSPAFEGAFLVDVAIPLPTLRAALVVLARPCEATGSGCVDGMWWSRAPDETQEWSRPTLDGVAWPTGARVYGVGAGGPGYIAVGSNADSGSDTPAVWSSLDGRDWSEIIGASVANGALIRDVVGYDSGFMGIGSVASDDVLLRSEDGVIWSEVDGGNVLEGAKLNAIAGNADGLLLCGSRQNEPEVWRSRDGSLWQTESLPGLSFVNLRGIAGAAGAGVAVVGDSATGGVVLIGRLSAPPK
jgi:DNA-binding SARP family transcriptional activator